ncbi:hypothetical protein B1218_34790, partial [Pseudomonas ogarae]
MTACSRAVQLPTHNSNVSNPTATLEDTNNNSERTTEGSDIEETAQLHNLKGAEDIARQLRLSDIGGLIVIDFNDMAPAKNERAVEEKV